MRKHLSRVKGGQLARRAHPATVVSLVLSDVVGDDLNVIASGPTVPDPSTFARRSCPRDTRLQRKRRVCTATVSYSRTAWIPHCVAESVG